MFIPNIWHPKGYWVQDYLFLRKKWDGIIEFRNLINFSPYLPRGNYSTGSSHLDPTEQIGSLDNGQVAYMNDLS